MTQTLKSGQRVRFLRYPGLPERWDRGEYLYTEGTLALVMVDLGGVAEELRWIELTELKGLTNAVAGAN